MGRSRIARLNIHLFVVLALIGCARDKHPAISEVAGVTRVWAIDDGEKVKQDDLRHWAASAPENSVWNGNKIAIFGARNEIVAFQLIIEAAGTGARGVHVLLDSLRGPGSVIANRTVSRSPFDFAGRHIELFLEHYVHVTRRSYSGGVSTWAGARPLPDEEHLGWIPDALIPFEATPGTAEWIGGTPFDIGAGHNQGVWIDIMVPRDAAPGRYQGAVKVTEGGRIIRQLPLELEVYGFTLSDSTHFRNFFHFEPVLLERHPGIKNNSAAYWTLFDKYMKLFHRHRMDLTDGRRKLSEFGTHLGGYYTGTAYTPASGYDGPGRGVGNGTYSIGTYDQFGSGHRSGFTPATREGWWLASDAWESWFRSNAPDVTRFKYMRDEPDFQADTSYAYSEIRRRAEWLRSNPGIGRELKTFCTVKMDPRLYGSIDIWSVTSQSGYDPGDGIPQGYIIKKADLRRALDEEVGFYNGTRPSYGLLEWIDSFATDARVNPWIAWKYRVDHYFLWETGFIYNKRSGPKLNVWTTPFSGGSPGKIRWGIGTIIYTGNDSLFPHESRGVDGPIASIRMKNWRRGQQDYEYLHLAREAGVSTTELVDKVVPAALDDYSRSSFTKQSDQPLWATKGFQFERVRRDLARSIEYRLKNRHQAKP